MNFLSESGDVSTTRLIAILGTLTVFGVWAYVSVMKLELQPISIEQLGAVIALLTAKVIQKGKETSKGGEQ